jgi:hypothetical protein
VHHCEQIVEDDALVAARVAVQGRVRVAAQGGVRVIAHQAEAGRDAPAGDSHALPSLADRLGDGRHGARAVHEHAH